MAELTKQLLVKTLKETGSVRGCAQKLGYSPEWISRNLAKFGFRKVWVNTQKNIMLVPNTDGTRRLHIVRLIPRSLP